jgi:hypothetical protein
VFDGGVLFEHDVTFPQLSMLGGSLGGNVNMAVTGPFTWSGGTLGGFGRMRVDGTLVFSGSGGATDPELYNITLDIAGAATWTSGRLVMVGSPVLNVLPGATFVVQAGGTVAGGGFGTFNNAGTFTVLAGGISITSDFDNTGTVAVQGGTLQLADGSSSGPFTVAAGATLTVISAETYTFQPSAGISGAGNVTFGAPNASGTVYVAGPYDVGGRTTVAGGTADFSTPATTGTATLTAGTLTGVGDFTVTGLLTWAGGYLSGTGQTFADGGLAITGGGQLQGRTLNNAGTATWTGTAGLAFTDGAVFNNLPGATFDVQNDASIGIGFLGFTPTFVNAGTFRKSAGTGTTTVSARFTNSGTVAVQTGTLSLAGPFPNFSADTSWLTGGTYQVAGTLQFTGAHVVAVAANLVLDGSGPGRLIDQNGNNGLASLRAIDATGRLTLQNGFHLATASDLENAGYLLIDPTSTLAVTGSYTQDHAATLEVQLGGAPASGLFGTLAVGGTANLDGSLALTPVNGYVPATGDAFGFLTYGSRQGEFASSSPGFALSYDDLNGILTAMAQ